MIFIKSSANSIKSGLKSQKLTRIKIKHWFVSKGYMIIFLAKKDISSKFWENK